MLIDSVGNEYEIGAIVRIYHFTGAKKRKHFMYKQVIEINEEKERVGFCHLPVQIGMKPELSFSSGKDELEEKTVIVQNYYTDMRDLKRNLKLKD